MLKILDIFKEEIKHVSRFIYLPEEDTTAEVTLEFLELVSVIFPTMIMIRSISVQIPKPPKVSKLSRSMETSVTNVMKKTSRARNYPDPAGF